MFSQTLLTGTYEQPNGNPAQGFVQFTPTAEMANGDLVIPGVSVSSQLDQDGRLTSPTGGVGLPLYANNDAHTVPQNQGYIVQEFIGSNAPTGPTTPTPYIIIVPANVGTVDISTLIPASALTNYYDYTVVYDSTFEAAVDARTLDQIAAAQGAVNINGQRLLNVVPNLYTDGGSAYGQLLALQRYGTATATQYSLNGTNVDAAIDSTNLTLEFTALSTETCVELTSACIGNLVGSPTGVFFGLFEHGTTTLQPGTSWHLVGNPTTEVPATTVKFFMTSTPGTTYQVDWAWALTGTADLLMYAGGTSGTPTATGSGITSGPLVMEAFALT